MSNVPSVLCLHIRYATTQDSYFALEWGPDPFTKAHPRTGDAARGFGYAVVGHARSC